MKKKIFLVLLIIIIINIFKITNQNTYIPSSSIRLRVIPNSNDPIDINIKEQVKTYLENNIYTLTKDIDNIEEARTIIKNNIPAIKNNIDTVFLDNKYNLPYDINYGLNYFPEKEYKKKTYKEGYYESLVISIGEANGDNWWCVLFPNYCLIDVNKETEYRSYIKDLLHKILPKE